MAGIRSLLLPILSSSILACGGAVTNTNGGDGGSRDDDGGFTEQPQTSCEPSEDEGPRFYVTTDGDDDGGDGSEASPWGSIAHAIENISDGSTLLVGPGTYNGAIRMDAQFAEGVVVRAEPAYQARLRNDDAVISIYEGQGITISGFDIAHDGPGAGPLLIHIQDLIGDSGGADAVSRIVLRNNIVHDSYNNDLLKINNGARDILVERNIFYNQQGTDEHIDVNSVADVTIQDNIFFNDFEASGRDNDEDTSSFIVIKDSNGDNDSYEGAERIVVRRNVFANYQGSSGANFLLVGEDGNPYHEAVEVLFENNLLVGNSGSEVRAPLGIKGGRDIVFRHNTVVGDMPGAAFAFRFNQEGDNPTNQNISLYNNIWSDPTGSMADFSDTPEGETESFTIDNNLYWNGGQTIPIGDDLINYSDDAAAVSGDPQIANTPIPMPTWLEDERRFADGSGDICLAFERMVESYGLPASDGAATGAARADQAPETDILGKRRSGAISIGAVEP
tara:strand:+ start:51952 stop:53463 length:1512 start_codon:yes stop_codon:yes gene_type:complete